MVASVFHKSAMKIASYTGWRRYALCYLFGTGTALALAPTHLIVLAALGFSQLYLTLENSRTKRMAFLSAWWFGFGYFVTGLYWVSISFMVDAKQYGWAVPFAVFGLTGFLALYPALVGVVLQLVKQKGWRGVVLFSMLWVLSEYLRAHLFYGFPWNLVAYMWTLSDGMIQSASWFGVYGLGFLTILLLTMPAVLIKHGQTKPLAIMVALALLVYGGGLWRLSMAEVTYVENVKLRLVQASIEQKVRWDPAFQTQAVKKHIELSTINRPQDVTHVVWAETAMPFQLNPYSKWADLLANAAPPGGGLITGYIHTEGNGSQNWKAWNSMTMVASDGSISKPYDKHKLVPFGEFMPLAGLLPKQMLPGPTGFAQGIGPETVKWPGLPEVSPLVCYEAIFPELSVDKNNLPDWILNLTNDAWFGRSSGPYQHLAMVRMRAVEQGLAVVRVANSGITAVIDPYGRIVDQLGLGVVGAIDALLPSKVQGGTLYSRISDFVVLFLIVILGIALIVRRKI
jgi:apolipoprotein N-acyltransferase